MTNQNEDSFEIISPRAVALLNFIGCMEFKENELIDVYLGLCDRLKPLINPIELSSTEPEIVDFQSFHGDGFDRYVENLIQDIQDEQENSVDDLA